MIRYSKTLIFAGVLVATSALAFTLYGPLPIVGSPAPPMEEIEINLTNAITEQFYILATNINEDVSFKIDALGNALTVTNTIEKIQFNVGVGLHAPRHKIISAFLIVADEKKIIAMCPINSAGVPTKTRINYDTFIIAKEYLEHSKFTVMFDDSISGGKVYWFWLHTFYKPPT